MEGGRRRDGRGMVKRWEEDEEEMAVGKKGDGSKMNRRWK